MRVGAFSFPAARSSIAFLGPKETACDHPAGATPPRAQNRTFERCDGPGT
jgi:hypothetical protein